MIRFEDCSCCTYTICANSERVTLSQIPLLFLNNFLLLIQCSVVFGGRYMCICQTCVSVQVCSFLQSFPCHLQRHNYTIYMYVLLSQKMYLVQFWEFWKNKKIKKKKNSFFPRQKGQTLEYGCGMNFQSKLFLRWKQYSP